MIKVSDLIKDGIWLVKGDVVANPSSFIADDREGVAVDHESWLGEKATEYLHTGRFEDWYVKSLVRRTPHQEESCTTALSGADAAIKTLNHLGYTWKEGTELWRPPLGEKPDFEEKIYTETMFDEGILPEVGEIISDRKRTGVVCYLQSPCGSSRVQIHTGSWYCYLEDLTFPQSKESLENKAKALYYKHMELSEEGFDYMWNQCSNEYRQAWITIAGVETQDE